MMEHPGGHQAVSLAASLGASPKYTGLCTKNRMEGARAGPTLIFMVLGARAVISFCILSAMPGYMVVPPERTLLAYKSLRMSMSHFMMEL